MPTTPFDYAGLTALVTGASRGIGAEIARQIAGRGVSGLVLVARSEGDLNTLADELRERYAGLRVEVIAANLAEPDAPARVKAETDRRDVTVDLLVNNAGFGSYGFFDQADSKREASMISVNIAALSALTHLYLPAIVARDRGGVLNIASTAAFQPVPYMATYGATKAFVLSFSEALWAENRDRKGHLRIACLCPGGVATAFDFGENAIRGRFEKLPLARPDDVARAGLNALDTDACYTVPGAANYVGVVATRLAPRSVVARAAAALFRPAPDKPDAAPSTPSPRTVIAGAAPGRRPARLCPRPAHPAAAGVRAVVKLC